MENGKYPIGQFEEPSKITKQHLNQWISEISTFQDRFKEVVDNIKIGEQSYTYRIGAWNIMQLVHHIADSQISYYIRIKLALTEETPTIRPFEETEWALLSDTQMPISVSIKIIEGVNSRLSHLIQHLEERQFNKVFLHPTSGKQTIAGTIGFCAWHLNHHQGHIQNALAKRIK